MMIYGGRTFIQERVLLSCRPPPRRKEVVGGRRLSAVVGRRRVALGLAVCWASPVGPGGVPNWATSVLVGLRSRTIRALQDTCAKRRRRVH